MQEANQSVHLGILSAQLFKLRMVLGTSFLFSYTDIPSEWWLESVY